MGETTYQRYVTGSFFHVTVCFFLQLSGLQDLQHSIFGQATSSANGGSTTASLSFSWQQIVRSFLEIKRCGVWIDKKDGKSCHLEENFLGM